MKKLYCVICDYCRIIIAYNEGPVIREWLKTEEGKDFCSLECKHLEKQEIKE